MRVKAMRRWAIAALIGLCAVARAAEGDPLMGDWEGRWRSPEGEKPIVAQVLALGQGHYRLNLLTSFDQPWPPLAAIDGQATGDQGHFGPALAITPDFLGGTLPAPLEGTVSLRPVRRLSPTLGASPPAGAVVLFDGSGLDAWRPSRRPQGPVEANRAHVAEAPAPAWRLGDDGAMESVPKAGPLVSREVFGDHRLHLEFRTPFMPEARGQARGNSGVYLQGRYEVQILDSYGLEGRDNECGGIYKVARPRVNACAPPLQWQTYDIEFRAPRFDANGTRQAPAVVTVRHNGVLIQDRVALPGPTGGGQATPVDQPGPLLLQDHGNPVQFRTIWVVPLTDEE